VLPLTSLDPVTAPDPIEPDPIGPPPRSRDFDSFGWRRRAAWVILLGAMTAVGAFTIDLYLPAFPVMQRELHTSAGTVQLTLTGTLLGFAAGQLIAGPLSDAFGRRRPLAIGLLVHLLASLGCALSPSIEVLGFFRICQGAGTAAASVVALAVVRDRFDGHGASRLIARLMLIIGVSPILAPTLGSALLPATGWRGIFLLLGLMSFAVGAVSFVVLPETLSPERRRSSGARAVFGAYREVLSDRPTVWLLAVTGLSTAALFAYVSGSSFVFQDQFHLSGGQYGLVFAAGGVCLIVGSQISGSLVHRLSPQTLLTVSLIAGTVFGSLLFLAAALGRFGLAGILVPMCGVLAAFGLGQPAAPAIALDRHSGAAGTTAALLGALQFAIAASAAPLVSMFGLSPAVGMAVVIVGGVVAALVVYLLFARRGLRSDRPGGAAAGHDNDAATYLLH
jgi:DHA1 family bicyclomycin/chloramphenicol resistance-like MFS transporter